MTSTYSLFTSVLIFSFFQYLKLQTDYEEYDTGYGQKSNVGSKVIYLFGVVLFIHRFEREPWRQMIQPFRMVFDVLSVLLVFEFLYSFLWLRLEFLLLEVVPRIIIKSSELYTHQIPEWPFILPLYVISLLFLAFAQNSDIYIDHYLQLNYTSDESDEEVVNETLSSSLNPVVPSSAGGFGDPVTRVVSLLPSPSFPPAHTPVTVVPTRGRGTHTLTDHAPLRRSERLQNRSY